MASSKLFVSDFDGVFYAFRPEHAESMDMAFAAAALSLNPYMPSFGAGTALAKQSYIEHGDSTTVFVEMSKKQGPLIDQKHLHRLAHMILDTRGWDPVEQLAEQIQNLQRQGQFVIWTHGSKETVMQNMDRLGIYGLVNEKDVYDMHEIGRKDVSADPYLNLCDKYGVQPDNSILFEDTLSNLKEAKKVGFHTSAIASNDQKQPDYVDFLNRNARKAFRSVANHVKSAVKVKQSPPSSPNIIMPTAAAYSPR